MATHGLAVASRIVLSAAILLVLSRQVRMLKHCNSSRSIRRFLHLAFLACAAGFATASPLHSQEAIELPSATFEDLRQLAMREAGKPQKVAARLTLPDAAQARAPAVVIVHTLAGYQDANEGWHAQEFRKAGFATLTFDTFASRGLNPSSAGGAALGLFASGVADAYAALRFLADHPKIDPAKIAIVGFSFGGEVAHLTALRSFQAARAPGNQRFAAHVATYPAGIHAANADGYSGAPVLMLVGGKDDNLPLTKVQALLDYGKQASTPFPVEARIYPEGLHAWTVSTLGGARFYPRFGSTKLCPYILLQRGGAAQLINGEARPFDPHVMDQCMRTAQGYTMGFDRTLRDQSMADTIAFLRRSL
jgi:dienelactone hydrolase